MAYTFIAVSDSASEEFNLQQSPHHKHYYKCSDHSCMSPSASLPEGCWVYTKISAYQDGSTFNLIRCCQTALESSIDLHNHSHFPQCLQHLLLPGILNFPTRLGIKWFIIPPLHSEIFLLILLFNKYLYTIYREPYKCWEHFTNINSFNPHKKPMR